MTRRLLFTCALAALIGPAVAQAQTSASSSINVTATVLSPISITAGQALDFGKMGQGTAKTIAPDDASSGRFIVTGTGGASFDLTLTLPTRMDKGGDNIPLSSWTGKHGNNADAAGGTAFTPTSGSPQSYTFPGTGASEVKFFRVGATATAAGGQVNGDYTGTISIAVIYTGI